MSNSTRENISVIKEQIDNFDNKASILIAIASVVFTLSLNILDYVEKFRLALPNNLAKYIALLACFSLYCVAFSLLIVFSVLVIYPRKNRFGNQKSAHYYMDVSQMSQNEIACTIAQDNSNSDIEQLQLTAKICAKKHKFIVCAIWTLIPLFMLLFAMCFMVIA